MGAMLPTTPMDMLDEHIPLTKYSLNVSLLSRIRAIDSAVILKFDANVHTHTSAHSSFLHFVLCLLLPAGPFLRHYRHELSPLVSGFLRLRSHHDVVRALVADRHRTVVHTALALARGRVRVAYTVNSINGVLAALALPGMRYNEL